MQLYAGQRGNGALFHDELRAAGFGGDLPGDVVDRREIGFAGILGGSADTNENDFAGADGFAGVGGVDDFLFPDGLLKDFAEVLLVDGNFAGFQLVDAIRVDVGAKHFVARRGEACSSHQSNVTTPDYRQSHLSISFWLRAD